MVVHRNNYLNTVEGQVSLRHWRKRKRLLISLINIEPRSKLYEKADALPVP